MALCPCRASNRVMRSSRCRPVNAESVLRRIRFFLARPDAAALRSRGSLDEGMPRKDKCRSPLPPLIFGDADAQHTLDAKVMADRTAQAIPGLNYYEAVDSRSAFHSKTCLQAGGKSYFTDHRSPLHDGGPMVQIRKRAVSIASLFAASGFASCETYRPA